MYKKIWLLALALVCLSNFGAFAQQTTIWLVRHAEKQAASASMMSASDPELSELGIKRAADLAGVLKGKKINAIYSTNYKRTLATVAPLAAGLKLTPATYDPREANTLATKLIEENKGKEILIVGHSNTLIPLAKALQATVPFETLTDDTMTCCLG
ncbi:phosphoglycerate mutase family protein [Mucilaginibacter sp. PAMB04168]|uniref:phosphoglycerate mutase family protein n=1 Tax=Mucilaginibacter sp. PAMB04168 TaxID=3138567 RepID=UPI0031F6A0B3